MFNSVEDFNDFFKKICNDSYINTSKITYQITTKFKLPEIRISEDSLQNLRNANEKLFNIDNKNEVLFGRFMHLLKNHIVINAEQKNRNTQAIYNLQIQYTFKKEDDCWRLTIYSRLISLDR